MADKCACMAVVAFGEIKRLQRTIDKTHESPAFWKPSSLEIEIAEGQHRNTIKYVAEAEEECKINLEKVRGNLIDAMRAFKEGEAIKALDKVIDADVSLRLAICPKEYGGLG